MTVESSALRFIMSLAELKFVPRTGWVMRGINDCEDVAAHSFGVVATTMLLADLLDTAIDREKALKMAILHDLAEAVVTDLPWSASRLLPSGAKMTMESEALNAIVGSLPAGDQYRELWQEYATGASSESRLVHDADVLELLVQAYVYERAGHRGLDEFWEGRSEEDLAFPETKHLIRQLEDLRKKLPH